MMKRYLLLFSLLFLIIFNQHVCAHSSPLVYVYINNRTDCEELLLSLKKLDVNYELINNLSENDTNLYILADVFKIEKRRLPKYYITYQTLDLGTNILSQEYLEKLSNSVVVLDANQDNINKYNSHLHNYFYFPSHYEFADPVLLSCFLPVSFLDNYKNLLSNSNANNTDISSHLPTLFCHGILQQPKVVVEAGVRGGESTLAFRGIVNNSQAHLIGIDIDQQSSLVYKNIANSTFLAMNDLDFAGYYLNSVFKNLKIDHIFIDTSHLYDHTYKEIKLFEGLLNDNGIISFHDSNVTPLNNGTGYIRLNGTYGSAYGNTRGVTEAIKHFFSIKFDEHRYNNFTFIKDNISWQLIHYPFCNGLTLIRKIGKNN